ncbi:kinase-like domain-containing protein [Xylariaceae sp. FL0662B]|nr:kinase-like domain-containing protein [Xylariaceae sp. FL0662B]
MPSPPEVLFFLKPRSPEAEKVVEDGRNSHLVSIQDGSAVLEVGSCLSNSSSLGVLATLGRSDSMDIYIDSPSVSLHQSSFEMNMESQVVMFHDKSPDQSSQVFSEEDGRCVPFEYGRSPRQIVVKEKLNTIIGMGGLQRNRVVFELVWRQTQLDMAREVDDLAVSPHGSHESAEDMLNVQSRVETRIHTQPGQEIRYELNDIIGRGGFGVVHKALNYDTGNLMAVKIMKQPKKASKWRERLRIKDEIETLCKLRHPHIIDYIGMKQGTSDVRIFMGLKDGSLSNFTNKPEIRDVDFLKRLLHQMLQALDFLASKGISHRDVKPANILYKLQGSQYDFQLADFGLCLSRRSSGSRAGTHHFLAPEIRYEEKYDPSKVDVWSLYTTMLWMTTPLYRHGSTSFAGNYEARYNAIISSAPSAMKLWLDIEEMARIDPKNRASAAQMLAKCYDGVGMSTRSRIEPIPQAQDDTAILNTLVRRARQREENRRLKALYGINSTFLPTDDSDSTRGDNEDVDENDGNDINEDDNDDDDDDDNMEEESDQGMEEGSDQRMEADESHLLYEDNEDDQDDDDDDDDMEESDQEMEEESDPEMEEDSDQEMEEDTDREMETDE